MTHKLEACFKIMHMHASKHKHNQPIMICYNTIFSKCLILTFKDQRLLRMQMYPFWALTWHDKGVLETMYILK